MLSRSVVLAASLASALFACAPRDRAWEHVAEVLRAETGDAAAPKVSFQRDSTHLSIHLQAAAFAGMPDSVFESKARGWAKLALRTYERGAMLDSITVSAGDDVAPNVLFRVVRSYSYAVASLR